MKIVCILLFVLAAVLGCSARPEASTAQAPTPPTVAPPPKADPPAKQVGRARAYYDARRDLTTASATGWVVGRVSGPNSPDSIEMMADFSVPGQVLATPTAVRLLFNSYVKQPIFGGVQTMAIVKDGREVFEGKTSLVRSDCSATPCQEGLRGPLVPFEVFKQVVAAGRIQLRFGNQTYDVGEDAREALRDLNELAGG
jgi:hypothetical protein